jgi:hypothetical protein
MLKPPGPPPPSDNEPSIGELIERLLDDAVDYGRAEIELIKAKALEFAEGYLRAAVLFAVAAVLALAGLVTLFVGIALGLERWMGPLGGAIVSMLIAGGIAGLLVWLAIRDLGKDQ